MARTLEQGLAPLEHRLAAIESQLGIAPPESPAAREPEKKGEAPQPSDA